MAVLMKDIKFEVPKRPVSEVFTYQHVLDYHDIEMVRRDPKFIERIKKMMARELADHICEKCQVFEIPSMADLYHGLPIRMELTINDRGAYENWIPNERREAHTNGVKVGADRVRKSIPYGFEIDSYYE